MFKPKHYQHLQGDNLKECKNYKVVYEIDEYKSKLYIQSASSPDHIMQMITNFTSFIKVLSIIQC